MISSSKSDRRGAGSRVLWIAAGIAAAALVVGLGAAEFARRHTAGVSGGVVPTDDDTSAMVLGLSDKRVADPAGRFAVTVPASWAVRTGERVAPNDMVLRGPQGLEVWVKLADVGYDRFDLLANEIRHIEETFGVNQNIRIITRAGAPAVERRIRLFEKEAIALDFLVGTTNHHVQLAARKEQFESLQPLLRSILDTYTPGTNAPPGT